MTGRGTSDRRICAFHEAGHCWGLWRVGRRFRYTTLRPRTAGFDGLTVLHRNWDFDETYPLAVVAVCGLLAELICRRSQTVDQNDADVAAHLAAIAAGGHDDVPKCRMLLHDSQRLSELSDAMQDHWAGISRVAEELHEHGTLTGRTVFAILDDTQP